MRRRADRHLHPREAVLGAGLEDRRRHPFQGRLTRKRIPLTNDYLKAGQRYQLLEQWEKDDLVGGGVGIALDEVKDLPPLADQTLSEDGLTPLKNLGANGPRDVEGLTMTHCVPNEHVVVTR